MVSRLSFHFKLTVTDALTLDTSGTPHGNVHWKVPRTVNSLFTGRIELLVRIQTFLRSDTTSSNKQKRFVITGLGGQGKSEICLRVLNLMKDEYVLIILLEVTILFQLTAIASGEYFGSTSTSLLPLSVTLSALQRKLEAQSRASLVHFKFFQLRIETGSSSSIMPTTLTSTTKSTFHQGLTVPFL
jgi:hypothetical protein